MWERTIAAVSLGAGARRLRVSACVRESPIKG